MQFLGACFEGGGGALRTLSEELCNERALELMSSCVVDGRTPEDCGLLTLSFEGKCNTILAEVDDWYQLARLAPPRLFFRFPLLKICKKHR